MAEPTHVSLTEKGAEVAERLRDEIEMCLLARGEDVPPVASTETPTRCAHCHHSIKAHAYVREYMKESPWPEGIQT